MVRFFMTSAKMATPGHFKIKIFWNNCYDFIIFVHDVTKKILSCESNYVVYEVIWPKFGNSSVSMTEVITTSIFKDLTRKIALSEGGSGFKFNNFGLAIGTNLKFYTSVIKELKINSENFGGYFIYL